MKHLFHILGWICLLAWIVLRGLLAVGLLEGIIWVKNAAPLLFHILDLILLLALCVLLGKLVPLTVGDLIEAATKYPHGEMKKSTFVVLWIVGTAILIYLCVRYLF
jgi:hypothetical protein